MSTVLAPAPPEAAAPSAKAGLWRRSRVWVVVAAAFLAAVVVAVVTTDDGGTYGDPLDPRNPGGDGAQAVARVVEGEGVDVTIARSADDLERTPVDTDTTVLVTGTERLAPSTIDRLLEHAGDARLVLVEPPHWVLEELPDAPREVLAESEGVPGTCTGEPGGPSYDGLEITVDDATAYDAAAGCFPSGEGHLLATEGGIAYLGAGAALTNDQVLRDDNAAVVLRLLGQHERLVWYLPSYDDAVAGEEVSLTALAPEWVVPALWTALLAVVALMLWRGRRLGRLSTEPLPVVVRAVETARSRGRMYRRAGDHAYAAGALRAAARRRFAARLRLGRGADEETVIGAVAQQSGRPVEEVGGMLSSQGPVPASDGELVRLAQELTRLDREVRRG